MKANYGRFLGFAVLCCTAMALLAGCDTGTGSDAGSDTGGVRFQAAIDGAQSRAVGTTWTKGDAIGISMLASGGTGIVDGASNRQYVTEAGNGSFAPASGVNPISVSGKVDFIAYYPYTGSLNGFRYPVDVSNQTNQEAIDLMTAEKATADQNAGTVALNFKHRLSGVELKITAGTNVSTSELSSVTAAITGQAIKGWYDVNANELTSTEGATQSLAFKMSADGKTGEVVILPVSRGSARTMKLTMRIADSKQVTFTKKIADDKAFEGGVKYQFPITLNRKSDGDFTVTGGFPGTIEDWDVVVEEATELEPDDEEGISVTVSPSSVSVEKGKTQQFTAVVSGTGNPSQSVSWIVSGGGIGTSINASGLLTVGANETATSLTVKATSTADSAKSGTATVTVTTPTPVPTNPISVQQALRNAQITQVTSPQFRTAVYDEDLKYVLLAYKVGTIKNMFLQYLSNPVVAAPGRKFSYAESRTSSVTEQTEHMNMTTTNISGNVKFAFAGASASASAGAIALPVAAGATAKAKAEAYGVKGGISFDYNSVTKYTYTETYTNSVEFKTEMEQDLSMYPAGKVYAVASFADVGVYQFLKYNIESKTATAIPGKSMWFNVEELPRWDVCEYNRDEELSLPNKLTPFERLSVQVNEADLYKALKTTHTETRTTDLTTPDNNSNSKDEIVSPTLIVPLLKHFGYNNVKIDVQFRCRVNSVWGGKLRLQIANADKTAEFGRVEKDLGVGDGWKDGPLCSVTTGIDSLNSAEGVFTLLWSKTGTANYSVGNRTITITATK